MKTPLVLLLLIFASYLSFSQEQEAISEAISPAKPVHLVGNTENVKDFVKQYVENAIAAWQKRGEFEKSSDYRLRVTPETRKKKAGELADIAFSEFKKAYIAALKSNDFVLGDYDADNETFLVKSVSLGDFVIPVSIDDAPGFKTGFYNMAFSDYDFYIHNDDMQLAKLSIQNKTNGKKYVYNSQTPTNYVVENMAYNFEPIDINMDETTRTGKASNITHKNTNVGNDPVDINIPKTDARLDNTFALVIGNQNYSNEMEVPHALNDAKVFAKYLKLTLGIPENRITILENATLGSILGAVGNLKSIAKTYQGEAKIIVYYAGHGMPDNSSKDAYILPVDGNSGNMATAYSLGKLYDEITAYQTQQVTVLLDACFSGAARDVSGKTLATGRGLSIEPNKEILQGNFVAFSAATGKQTAHPYEEKGHGLFTYFLLLKMQQTKGNITFGELFEYLNKKVSRTALDFKKNQTPEVNASPEISDGWTKMKF
jgi:hypothetical protein